MKILIVTTVSNTINSFLIPHLKKLKTEDNTIHIACNITQELSSELIEVVDEIYDIPFSRFPFSKDNIKSVFLLNELMKNNYDIVHTHTPIASMIVRLVFKNSQTKIFYTAHGFHFFKGSSLYSKLVYFNIEKILSKFTHTLITINKEDYLTAKKKLKMNKLIYIRGVGFNSKKYNVNKIKDKTTINFLSVGELNNNKNHKAVLYALSKIKNNKFTYTICGEGPQLENLENLAIELSIKEKVIFAGYQKDLNYYFNNADIFVFPSYREGLPLSIMEAMYFELPIIASDIRGNRDLVIERFGGRLFNPDNTYELAYLIELLINNKELREVYGRFNKQEVEKYSLENIIEDYYKIYEEVVGR